MPLIHELSWTDAGNYLKTCDVAILPCGSTEQHGPHNPLGTDHLLAAALAKAVSEKTDVLCTPVVPVGVSSHHRHFWGSLYVNPEVFKNYIKGICLSLFNHGVRKVLIVNGHGGNMAALRSVARELRMEGEMFVAITQWWTTPIKALEEEFNEDERSHAGCAETSMNLTVHSWLVKMDKAVNEIRGEGVAPEGFTYAADTLDRTSSGVSGTSTTASPDKGKKVFDENVDLMTKFIEQLKITRIEDLLPKPHKS